MTPRSELLVVYLPCAIGNSVLNRDSPNELRTHVNIRAFPAFPQDRRAVPTVTSNLGRLGRALADAGFFAHAVERDLGGVDLRGGCRDLCLHKIPKGWCIVFPCAIFHAVTRVTKGRRYVFCLSIR